MDQMLHNLGNEEYYEEINLIQINELHDWMDVAAGPQNINHEVDLGKSENVTRYKWHSISSEELLKSLENFIENEKKKNANNQWNPAISNPNYLLNFVFSDEHKK